MSDFSQERESGGASEGGGSPGLMRYPLLGEAIDHWLLAGPVAVSLMDSAPSTGVALTPGPGTDHGQLSLFLHNEREKRSILPFARGTQGEFPAPAILPYSVDGVSIRPARRRKARRS